MNQSIISFRRACLLSCVAFAIIASTTTATEVLSSRLPSSISPVKVNHRQLIVDGKPFIMKGVCYNPVRKGQRHPAGLMTLHPSEKDLAAIEKDFKMMHEAGINTIRSYEPIVDPRILDLLRKYQLYTIVPVCGNCKEGLYAFASTIERLKNHPSTLLWEIGNEWNFNFFYSTEPGGDGLDGKVLSLKESAQFVEMLAAFIKSQDKNHPVSTDVGDLPNDLKNDIQHLFKNIDLYGMNVYDGLSFGDRLERWKEWSDKPLYIGECGAVAFNQQTNSYDPASQAKATRSIVTESLNNLSAKNKNNVLVGVCLFEWNDEWWKDPKGSPDTHTTGGFKVDKGGPYPAFFFNEEWFGVVTMEREPRPAYFVLKELFVPEKCTGMKDNK
ncbi:MAG: hypothetical protein K2W99_00220 [Chthoniobacterales bacterium]|nr:hypothetical protein [Chthoniobacterales bacterium]